MLVSSVGQSQKKPSIGVMQGRLTSARGRGLQFFPFGEWEEEFRKAAKLGLSEIDFSFDERYSENPLWSQSGLLSIKALISETGVRIKSICADYFMRLPSHDWLWADNDSKFAVCLQAINRTRHVGGEILEIPLLVNSSVNIERKRDNFVNFLRPHLPIARSLGVTLAVETDLSPQILLLLIKALGEDVKVVYDTGYSAYLGYDPEKEIGTYGNFIANVHIKDMVYGGNTVSLGTGDTNFDKIFMMLAKQNYQGSFILQAVRDEDGREMETIANQINFLSRYLKKYGFLNPT